MEKNFFNDNDLSDFLRHVSLDPETEQLIIDRMNNMDQEMCCGSSDCKEEKCCSSDVGENFAQPRESVISEDTNKVYLFTASAESDESVQLAEMKAKSKANILGLKKTRVEIIDLTGKEIVNKVNEYEFPEIIQGSYRMSYIDFSKDSHSNYDFISAGCGILELVDMKTRDSNKPYKLGIVIMAYSYNDDLEDLSKYITDGLMDVYASGYNNKYEIVNFHTAVEGFNPKNENAIVIAGLLD